MPHTSAITLCARTPFTIAENREISTRSEMDVLLLEIVMVMEVTLTVDCR